MPQYKKVFDIGTYTGNGGQYRVGIPTLRSVGPSGKQAAGSLRFRSDVSTDLRRTVSVAGNKRTWTWSGWIKRSSLASSTNANVKNNLFAANQGSYADFFGFDVSTNVFSISLNNTYSINSTDVIKDSSIWYHVVVVLDANNATAANRLIVYVNNRSLTLSGTIAQTDYQINTAVGHAIGSGHTFNGYYFNGYMSEVYFVDGTVLTPSSFGELNSDGIWVPKAYSGTYGTNGFYLPMNSSSNYATDQSGNGNNWTPNNFNVATSNATYSLFTDSPTDYGTDTGLGAQVRGNYCTWDPNTKGSTITLDSGNLGYTVGGGAGLVCPGTIRVSSGKWFWEVTLTSGYGGIGVAKVPYTAGMSYIGQDTTSWGFYSTLGKVYNDTATGAYGTYTTNDVIGVALDADAGSITFYKNGVSLGVAFTGMTGPYIPITSVNGAGSGMANFGQRAFAYAAPSGYKAICSTNIDRPADSSLWFYGDTPDLMWIKNRSTTGLHTITDTVRGMGLNLVTSSTAAEVSYPAVTEMNKFGMTVINDATSIVNGSTNSHVYWGWKANGSSTVTNTDGTITSRVSANRQAGFSIVTYTGTAANATVGHGLGAVPSFYIIHPRNDGTSRNWNVYHSSLGNTGSLYLNSTSAFATATVWNNTSPTSSVFSLGATPVGQEVNSSGLNYVAYCWAAIPGYSAFGTYTGNGSSDGPFIYTGFRPKFVITKGSSIGYDWKIFDSTRNPNNPVTLAMWTNLTNSDTTGTSYCDFYSNGFKMRDTDPVTNNSGSTYIYLAFADIPFKLARSR